MNTTIRRKLSEPQWPKQDPGDIFTPKPMVGRDANPRLSAPLKQVRICDGAGAWEYRVSFADGKSGPWTAVRRDFAVPLTAVSVELRRTDLVSK